MNIKDYGWDEYFEHEWKQNMGGEIPIGGDSTQARQPGRIVADYGERLRIISNCGEVLVNRPIKKHNEGMLLAVGDWVALEYLPMTQSMHVMGVLKRKTKFSRAAVGMDVKEQIVASNVDTVFLIQSLNRDFNMKRLERYLIAAWDSGALPVVVLTKADCCDNVAERMAMACTTSPGVEVHAISCITGEGIEGIKRYFAPGKTVALLGSSGVGKSTLVNSLAGKEILKTQEIRQNDCRGKHTTTHRELFCLPGGGLILDTPGMRTLSLWEAEEGMDVMFGDVEQLTKQCRFFDCQHQNEPGCAVQEALNTGKLEIKRWESWLKLQKELAHLEAKKEGKLRLMEKQWGKKIAKVKKELNN